MGQPSVEATLSRGPASVEEAGRVIASVEGYWGWRGFSLMAVIERATGLLVGRVGPWMPHGWPDIEIGWTIHPAARDAVTPPRPRGRRPAGFSSGDQSRAGSST